MNTYRTSKSACSNPSVKIKGRCVFIDGKKVAEITGWRDPSGRNHVPFVIRCSNGRNISSFAYAVDAQKYCRNTPEFIAEALS